MLAIRHCDGLKLRFDELILSTNSLQVWLNMLRFDKFPEGYDIHVSGEGVNDRVSSLLRADLEDPRVAQGRKRVIFSHLSRLVSRSVFTRFDSFLDERSSPVEFSKSGHFP